MVCFLTVAFTARFSGDTGGSAHGVSLGDKTILRLDKVVTNIGNGYNPKTGVFTAPIAGTYSFFLTAMGTNAHGNMELAIDKQGTVLALVWVEGTNDPYDKGSSQVTTHLATGDQVWVRHYAGDQVVRGSWWTVFTGYLLQAD